MFVRGYVVHGHLYMLFMWSFVTGTWVTCIAIGGDITTEGLCNATHRGRDIDRNQH